MCIFNNVYTCELKSTLKEGIMFTLIEFFNKLLLISRLNALFNTN